MKKFIFLVSILFLLTACPVGLDYAPGKVGTEKINSKLEGTWTFQNVDSPSDTEILKVSFKKIDNFSFKVDVLERGEMYSLDDDQFLAYETKIDNLHVIYFKPNNGSTDQKYYLYQYKLEKGVLTVADIPLLDGGIDSVTSSETLREQIIASMKKEEFYKDPKSYSKL